VRTGVVAVPGGDAHALAAAVCALWEDPALRDRLGREARSAVLTSYREQDMARRIEEVLASVMASTAPGQPAGRPL
jgi:glycosyltransferase involved in cell wall biosynthesis